uniref:Vexin n=1 Tax=Corvus moneduloides TaxID=1196302 RepID=A0A8U7P2K4_CORMO
MHQIYSCSDENLEVFTTVISSKSCSPARRRGKAMQHILTKSVVAISERQPQQGELLQVLYEARGEEEARGVGCLQGGQRGACPAKGTAQHGKYRERALFLRAWRTFLDTAVFQFAEKQELYYVPGG